MGLHYGPHQSPYIGSMSSMVSGTLHAGGPGLHEVLRRARAVLDSGLLPRLDARVFPGLKPFLGFWFLYCLNSGSYRAICHKTYISATTYVLAGSSFGVVFRLRGGRVPSRGPPETVDLLAARHGKDTT